MFRLKSPIIVQMEITSCCNNMCKFCYNEDIKTKYEYMTINDAKKIIDSLKDIDVFNIIITGGECLLHNQICEIIKYILDCGMLCSIITNGTLLEDMSDRLYETGLREIQVSLISSIEARHDTITQNKGSYKKAIRGIKREVKKGMRVSINVPFFI